MSKMSIGLILIAAALLVAGCAVVLGGDQGGETVDGTKTVEDMRGVEVEMPADPSRVAVVDRGFVAQVMVALDVDDRIVSQGGLNGARVPPPEKMRDTLLLNPGLLEIPNFGYPGYLPFSSEALAASDSDLVIWKQGVVSSGSPEMEAMEDFIVEKLKVPLFVIFEPGYDGTPATLGTVYDSISMIGEIFNKADEAAELIGYVEGKVAEVADATSAVAAGERPTVLVLGLANEGAGAYAYGPDYTHGLFIEDVAGVRNLVTEYTNQIIDLENLLKLDPDYIVLVDGPINPDLGALEEPMFERWGRLSAVRDGHVCSIGQLAWWGENMMNFPSIFMIVAQCVHPDLFEGVDVAEWIRQYEAGLYGITPDEAGRLMYGQKLYWDGLIPDAL